MNYMNKVLVFSILLALLSLLGCTPNLDNLESEVLGVWSFQGVENGVEINECMEVIREKLEFKFYRDVRRPIYNVGELYKKTLAKKNQVNDQVETQNSARNNFITDYEDSVQLIEGRWDFGRGRRFFVNAGYATSQDQMRIPKDGKRRRYHMMSIVVDTGEDYLVLQVKDALGGDSYSPKRYQREKNCRALEEKVDAMPLAEPNHEDFDLQKEAAGAFRASTFE